MNLSRGAKSRAEVETRCWVEDEVCEAEDAEDSADDLKDRKKHLCLSALSAARALLKAVLKEL